MNKLTKMEFQKYENFCTFTIIPTIQITYEPDSWLSIDFEFLKWGLSIVIWDK